MFTALDVALIVPLVFLIEGIQADAAKARLAVLTAVVAGAAGATVGVVMSPLSGLVVAGAALGAGYLAQLGYALRRRRDTPATSRPATWLASTVSVIHYVTAINLIGHPELRRDFLVRLVVVVMYVVHALAGLAIVFMLALAVPLNTAWGCYPPGKTLAQHDLGPCGEKAELSWVDPNPQAVCRDPEVQAYTLDSPCEAVLTGEQMFGPALAFALHAEAVAAAAYTLGCIHAYTIYFSDLKSPLPMRTPMAAFLQ